MADTKRKEDARQDARQDARAWLKPNPILKQHASKQQAQLSTRQPQTEAAHGDCSTAGSTGHHAMLVHSGARCSSCTTGTDCTVTPDDCGSIARVGAYQTERCWADFGVQDSRTPCTSTASFRSVCLSTQGQRQSTYRLESWLPLIHEAWRPNNVIQLCVACLLFILITWAADLLSAVTEHADSSHASAGANWLQRPQGPLQPH
jgi:hypothetical protein